MVKEIRHHHEQCRLVGLVAVVNDSCRQVGFTAAGLTHQHQPAIGFFGELKSNAECFFQILSLLWRQINSLRVEFVKGHTFLELKLRAPAVFQRGSFFLNGIYMTQIGVREAGAYSLFQLVNRDGGDNYGGQFIIKAIG